MLTDSFGREITYLRLSVTDRCNLRCLYCMGEDVQFLPRAEVLDLEELERLSAAFIRLGVRKLRLTGGEPLARPQVMTLISRLGRRLAAGEFEELTLTTNGTLLERYAEGLAAAGVRRVNVSLDTLDAANFRRIARHHDLTSVLAGIFAAQAAGLAVRINTVALAGINEHEFDALIAWCGSHGCDMALIEAMPLGAMAAHGPGDFLSLETVRRRLEERWTLLPALVRTTGPSRYVTVAETGRKLGFITPMSHGFCGTCNRVRVTCNGTLHLCLAQDRGVDLKAVLRGAESDEALAAAIVAAVAEKPVGHGFAVPATAAGPVGQRMWQLGG